MHSPNSRAYKWLCRQYRLVLLEMRRLMLRLNSVEALRDRQPQPVPLRVEQLEPRLMLAADDPLHLLMGESMGAPNDAVIEVVHGTPDTPDAMLNIVDRASQSVWTSLRLADVSHMFVHGNSDDNRLQIADSVPEWLAVIFVGGDGDDTIVGPNRDTSWVVAQALPDGPRANITVSGVENVLGGTGIDTLTGPYVPLPGPAAKRSATSCCTVNVRRSKRQRSARRPHVASQLSLRHCATSGVAML